MSTDIISLIQSCDFNSLNELYNRDPFSFCRNEDLLNTAIKTKNRDVINYIYEKIQEIHDSIFYNIINLDFDFIINNKMYSDFHYITGLMIYMAPDYYDDYSKRLKKIKSKTSDELIIMMIDNTIKLLNIRNNKY